MGDLVQDLVFPLQTIEAVLLETRSLWWDGFVKQVLHVGPGQSLLPLIPSLPDFPSFYSIF